MGGGGGGLNVPKGARTAAGRCTPLRRPARATAARRRSLPLCVLDGDSVLGMGLRSLCLHAIVRHASCPQTTQTHHGCQRPLLCSRGTLE